MGASRINTKPNPSIHQFYGGIQVKHLKIETDRMIIRAYQESDLHEAFKLMQDKDLFEYLPMEVMSFEDYKKLFSWLIRCYDVSSENKWFKYSFVITDKKNGKHLGWCGVGSLDYDHSDTEIFYLIGKPFWGNGYATEAVSGLMNYCFEQMNLTRLSALVKPDNIPSKKVIEKLGFSYQRTMSGLSEEFDFYNGELYYTYSKES
jgi:[ribosomal protein S5]-alanine N-acetyltransferase